MTSFSAQSLQKHFFKKILRKFAGRRRKFLFSYPQIALDRPLFLPKFWAPEFGGTRSPGPPQPTSMCRTGLINGAFFNYPVPKSCVPRSSEDVFIDNSSTDSESAWKFVSCSTFGAAGVASALNFIFSLRLLWNVYARYPATVSTTVRAKAVIPTTAFKFSANRYRIC